MTLFVTIVSVAMMAQTDVWYWQNGVAAKLASVDSITFAEPSLGITNFSNDGAENGHDYVDLGLPSGTKWATCNVGASKPQDYGNYYAWGEVTTKSTYSRSTCKYGSGYYELTKYCNNSSYGKDGFTDNKTTLELSDDAAYMNWGGKWRMPTDEQQDELRNECYWVWTESYNNSNVKGYIVYKAKASSDKGKKIYSSGAPSSSYSLSDAHIFLPAAGFRADDDGTFSLEGAGSYGGYWSSSLNTDYPDDAWDVVFSSGPVLDYSDIRWFGQSVRAVIVDSSEETDSNDNASSGALDTENGHSYVDLGLPSGTKWATCNIGASSPEEFGDYYAWGEVTPNEKVDGVPSWDGYGWRTYLDGNIARDSDCGTDRDLLKGMTDIAGTQYDAAKANWGGKWRMPTYDQQTELRNECYWEWTDNYNGSGVAGVVVYKAKSLADKGLVGNKNYNVLPTSSYSLNDVHIFLPAAGDYGDNKIPVQAYGKYWSSSLDLMRESWAARRIAFDSDGVNGYGGSRYYCRSVRAVIVDSSAETDSNDNASSSTVGVENGHDYVDLGLTSGTRWATMNVGASKPQDYGNYYAWGETTTKETYNWSTYKYGSNYNQLTKYCNSSSYGKDGFIDTKTTLDLSDDAAYVNWGGKWRMPTRTQQDELRNECYWVWTESYNGSNVKGYIVYKAKTSSDKGKKIYSSGTPSASYSLSDAHIFLPAAGYRYGGDLNDAGSYGDGWSSSLGTGYPYYAWSVHFGSGHVRSSDDYRYFGQSVRAVIPGE